MNKIQVSALGLSFGIVWAFVCLVIGIFGIYGRGLGFIELMSDFYIGYAPTMLGMLLGVIWGFIGGVLIAFVYNLFAKN